MWSLRGGGLSLAGQLLLLQLLVLTAVLTVVGVISVQQSTRVFEEQRGSQLRSVAEYLANVPVVRDQVTEPDAARALAPPVTNAFALSAADRVSVASPDGTLIASSDPAENGAQAALGPSRVVEGRGWSGDVEDGDRRVLAAHAPILANDGRLIGIAIAEADYPTVVERLTIAAPDLLLYLGLGALLGVFGSVLLSRLLWRRTRGLRSSEIATLADHREALLFSIREGVIAVGIDGRLTTVNDSARELLNLPADAVGRPVDELDLPAHVTALLLANEESHDAVLVVGDRVLVFNQRAASSQGEGIGTVTTLRDRTELVSLQNQLGSNLSLTDTLRAQTHEFANKLHTISGLLQLRQYDEVETVLGEMTRRRDELAGYVSDRISDVPLAALVIGKASVAEEARVELILDPRSYLEAQPADVSADLVTVVGNLVDNAIDACRGQARPTVELSVIGTDSGLQLAVRDNGPGIPSDAREAIFIRGFSTKDEVQGGRGIGLALVQVICGHRGGTVDVVREEGHTVFRVLLPLAEVARGGGS